MCLSIVPTIISSSSAVFDLLENVLSVVDHIWLQVCMEMDKMCIRKLTNLGISGFSAFTGCFSMDLICKYVPLCWHSLIFSFVLYNFDVIKNPTRNILY